MSFVRVLRLLVGDSLDFLERGDAALHLQEARLSQVANTFALRLLGDVERIAVAHDELLHVVGHRHYFVHADPALVAGSLAVIAANGPERLPASVELLFLKPGAQQRLGRNVLRALALRAE